MWVYSMRALSIYFFWRRGDSRKQRRYCIIKAVNTEFVLAQSGNTQLPTWIKVSSYVHPTVPKATFAGEVGCHKKLSTVLSHLYRYGEGKTKSRPNGTRHTHTHTQTSQSETINWTLNPKSCHSCCDMWGASAMVVVDRDFNNVDWSLFNIDKHIQSTNRCKKSRVPSSVHIEGILTLTHNVTLILLSQWWVDGLGCWFKFCVFCIYTQQAKLTKKLALCMTGLITSERTQLPN